MEGVDIGEYFDNTLARNDGAHTPTWRLEGEEEGSEWLTSGNAQIVGEPFPKSWTNALDAVRHASTARNGHVFRYRLKIRLARCLVPRAGQS